MQRGELWTLKDNNYASKARPVVIVQSDSESNFDSVILCLFTTFEAKNASTRVRIEPAAENGLENVSFVMTEKIVTVERTMLGKHRRMNCLAWSNVRSVVRNSDTPNTATRFNGFRVVRGPGAVW